MRNTSLLVPALLVAQALHAQYTIDWSHPAADTYKNGVMAARDTADNVIVVGTRTSSVGAANIYTQKYDKDGILLWEQVDATGVNGSYLAPTWVTTSATNNIFVTGYRYSGTGSIFPNQLVVLKYNAQGILQWRRTLDPTFTFGVYVRCAVDANDNLYVGAVGLLPGGFHLIKYDPSGNQVFHTVEANPIATTMTSMRLKGNRVVMSGTGIGAVHGAVATWDTAGNFLWSHLVTGFGAQDVEVDDALNTYVLTAYNDLVAPLSGRDVVINKFDAAGDSTTQFVYDFNGTDQPARMTLVNGKLTVIGWTIPQGGGYMNWTTFRTDLNGGLQWNATYNAMLSNDEIPGWVAARENGDVYVTGKGGPLYQGQYQQYVTLKYSNGVQQWAHTDPYYGYNGVACVLGKDSAVYVLGQGSMTVTRYIDPLPASIALVAPKVYLDGSFDTGTALMGDGLRAGGLLPLNEPYTALGYVHTGPATAPTTAGVLSLTGQNAIADWVLLELRDGNNMTAVVRSRSALVQRDGDVVDTDGVSPVSFSIPPGNYFVVVRHRNHLGCMTATPIALSGIATVVDLTSPLTGTYGTDARKSAGAYRTLWSGDTTFDGKLKYTGILNDRDPILVRIGGIVPTNTVVGYFGEDSNLDGTVKYTGTNNDRDPILVNIGGVVPTNTRLAQLP
ncbi:MAG: hypothetical protein IPI55_12445 [Flavobacteriales bacterium]|nr:hypothetical protein [Flavobacteriales bacterium]